MFGGNGEEITLLISNTYFGIILLKNLKQELIKVHILIEKSLFRADSHMEYGSHWSRKIFKDPDCSGSQAGTGELCLVGTQY